jgi:protein-S-isoprenylcysteine O-methyltransferase Ste14
MILFIKLLLAHLLGDFIWQPNSWVADKEAKKHKSIYLYLHILLHGVLAAILAGEIRFIPYAILIAVTHGIVDLVKLNFQKTKTKRTWFIVDQIVHILILAGIVLLYKNEPLNFLWFDNQLWILITGILLITKPTSIFIKTIISIWNPESQNSHNDNSLATAGNYIGILERLFVFCFILTGHFEAIGFLLAAKSIFRFGDLKEAKDRKLTEYVLIGTLISFGTAIIAALIVQALLLQLL